jgi:nucleoside-diphosphate-sugar epimerase
MTRSPIKRVLLTGASGTLGYNTVHSLRALSPEVSLCLLMRQGDRDLFVGLPNVAIAQVDLADTEKLSAAVSEFQPNAIIHCAAAGVRPSKASYFDLVNLNVSATMNLFRASCDIEGCHFINISTGLVYGSRDLPCREIDPVNMRHPYGATKAAADCLLLAGAEQLDRELTILRPFSFTGLHDGGDRLFPALLRAASEHKPLPMSAGTQLRDFCAVQDVADAITLLLEDDVKSGRDIFNVGSGLPISIGRIVMSVVRQLNLDVEIQFGARGFHPLEPNHSVADTSRIRALGWKPKVNLAYAVWQLARSQFPNLPVSEPQQWL